jgi:hypothetical protein
VTVLGSNPNRRVLLIHNLQYLALSATPISWTEAEASQEYCLGGGRPLLHWNGTKMILSPLNAPITPEQHADVVLERLLKRKI